MRISLFENDADPLLSLPHPMLFTQPLLTPNPAPPTLPVDPHGDSEIPVETPIDVALPNGEDAPDTALTSVLQASARVCLRTPRWLTSATLPAAAMATARRAGRESLLDEGVCSSLFALPLSLPFPLLRASIYQMII